eukprot:1161596-Pelagomonas_calceolata.AAC.9
MYARGSIFFCVVDQRPQKAQRKVVQQAASFSQIYEYWPEKEGKKTSAKTSRFCITILAVFSRFVYAVEGHTAGVSLAFPWIAFCSNKPHKTDMWTTGWRFSIKFIAHLLSSSIIKKRKKKRLRKPGPAACIKERYPN